MWMFFCSIVYVCLLWLWFGLSVHFFIIEFRLASIHFLREKKLFLNEMAPFSSISIKTNRCILTYVYICECTLDLASLTVPQNWFFLHFLSIYDAYISLMLGFMRKSMKMYVQIISNVQMHIGQLWNIWICRR